MSEPIRVLLIEDNPADADLTREMLEASKLVIEITVLHDGEQALEYLIRDDERAGRPNLILLDLNLPKLDGKAVLEELKRHERLRKIPVVILTSSDADQDVAKTYELGAACYVVKPVGFDAFRSIVHSVEGFWFSVVKLP